MDVLQLIKVTDLTVYYYLKVHPRSHHIHKKKSLFRSSKLSNEQTSDWLNCL